MVTLSASPSRGARQSGTTHGWSAKSALIALALVSILQIILFCWFESSARGPQSAERGTSEISNVVPVSDVALDEQCGAGAGKDAVKVRAFVSLRRLKFPRHVNTGREREDHFRFLIHHRRDWLARPVALKYDLSDNRDYMGRSVADIHDSKSATDPNRPVLWKRQKVWNDNVSNDQHGTVSEDHRLPSDFGCVARDCVGLNSQLFAGRIGAYRFFNRDSGEFGGLTTFLEGSVQKKRLDNKRKELEYSNNSENLSVVGDSPIVVYVLSCLCGGFFVWGSCWLFLARRYLWSVGAALLSGLIAFFGLRSLWLWLSQ